MRSYNAWFLLLSFAVLATACASLMDYSSHTESARRAASHGDYAQALSSFPEKTASGNEVLNHMERGTVLQNMGEFESSQKEYQAAVDEIAAYENRAVISATRTATGFFSLLLNEQVKPYEGKDFEKVMLHTQNALNYLLLGDLEGARVEIRNSYRRQEELALKHAKALEEAKNNPKSKGWEDALRSGDERTYESLKQTAAGVRNLYQNAFAYYVSSVVYEWYGEPDEAYIDLKKANDALPGCQPVLRNLLRLADKLHFLEDIPLWEKQCGCKAGAAQADGTDVFVVFEIGMAPVKEALSFPIITGSGIVTMAFPVYRFLPSFTKGGMVTAGERSEHTVVATDIDAMAARTLLDEFPMLFVKQVTRAAIKGYATHEMNERYNVVGAFVGSLFSIITEQADLRTWSMLPKQIQIARLFAPKDVRVVDLSAFPSGFRTQVNIPEGARRIIILVLSTDSGLSVQSKSF